MFWELFLGRDLGEALGKPGNSLGEEEGGEGEGPPDSSALKLLLLRIQAGRGLMAVLGRATRHCGRLPGQPASCGGESKGGAGDLATYYKALCVGESRGALCVCVCVHS